MLVVGRDGGMTNCIFIDGAGAIRHRCHPSGSLTPLWLSLSPKTAWPETSHVDLVAIEEEERQAVASRKAERKAARKAKRSNKLKRHGDAAA